MGKAQEMEPTLLGFLERITPTPCIGHFCRLKTSIMCVLIPKVSEQIMFLCTAQAWMHTHTHITNFLKKRLGGVTRPHDFQRGHLWSCVTKKHPCKDLFSLDLGNICLPVEIHDAEQRWCSIFIFFEKVTGPRWYLHYCVGSFAWPLGGQGMGQANMSAYPQWWYVFFLVVCTKHMCACMCWGRQSNKNSDVSLLVHTQCASTVVFENWHLLLI